MNKKLILAAVIIATIGIFGFLFFPKKQVPSVETKQSSPQNVTTSPVVPSVQPKAIEKIDFKNFLAQKLESADGKCKPGSTSISKIAYGDVTGDGVEEAVVDYYTCWNGTGGSNSEVYMIDSQNNLKDISPDSTKLSVSDREKFFYGFAGHGYYGINNSKLTFFFPIYKESDPNCCPSGGKSTITFGWNGSKFVYNSIISDPLVN